MENIIFKNGIITYGKASGEFTMPSPIDHYLIDDNSVHIPIGTGVFCFIISETSINGQVYTSVPDFLNALT